MQLKIYKIDGSLSDETIELPPSVFEIEPNNQVIYLAVKTYLSRQRQGTHKTKERSEVRGGGKKPWKQKGRGVARAGTSRSPLWVGGGTIHGPRPHTYKLRLTKKTAKIARKSALAIKAKEGEIMIIEDLKFEKPKTKDFSSILQNLKIDGKKILMLLAEDNDNLYKSGRNLVKMKLMRVNDASTYDLLNNQVLLIQKSAFEPLCKPLMN
jgi:large subunit ribosomal protein L4